MGTSARLKQAATNTTKYICIFTFSAATVPLPAVRMNTFISEILTTRSIKFADNML